MPASWNYFIDFAINQIFSRSIIDEPLELTGLLILGITGIIGVFLINWLFKNYRETKSVETLIFILGALFLFSAIIFLSIEKLSYSSWGLVGFGDLMAVIALILSVGAALCADIFTFRATYPDYLKILTTIFGIFGIIYAGTLCWAIIQGPPLSDIVNFEIVYSPIILLIVYCVMLPMLTISPALFFYYAKKTHKTDKPVSSRSFWMGLAFLCASIGFMNEVAPLLPAIFSTPIRSFYIFAALLWYICLTMPEWFKRRIGWTD